MENCHEEPENQQPERSVNYFTELIPNAERDSGNGERDQHKCQTRHPKVSKKDRQLSDLT